MKETYEKIKPLIEETMEKTKMNDSLTKFTAIYLPLANSLSEDKIDNHELFFLAFLTIYYLEEIEGYSEEIKFLLSLSKDKFKSNEELASFKKGLGLIISKNMIPEGVELIMPFIAEISKKDSKYRV